MIHYENTQAKLTHMLELAKKNVNTNITTV